MSETATAERGRGVSAPSRTPSEDPAWLERAANATLTEFDLPDGCAVAVVGSIAEGFGNDASDVDILVISAGDDSYSYSHTRFMTAFEQHRVEVYVRGASALLLWAQELHQCEHPALEDLDFYHRLTHAYALVDSPAFARLRAVLDPVWLSRVRCEYELVEARTFFARARLAAALERKRDSVAYAKKALERAAAYYAAAHGETYGPKKFLLRRLVRAGVGEALLQRYRELQATTDWGGDAFLSELQRVAADFRVELDLPGELELSVRPDVTRVSIGAHLIVTRGDASVVVYDAAHQLEVLLGGPIRVTAAQLGAQLAPISLLYRVGFLEARAGTMRWSDGRAHPPLGTLRVISEGLDPSHELVYVPVPGLAIARAGIGLLQGLFLLENCDEDAVGALQRGDWLSVDAGLRGMARGICAAALNHLLVTPAPAEYDCLEAMSIDPRFGELARLAERVEQTIVRGAGDVPRCYDAVRAVLAWLPPNVRSRHFLACHHQALKWAKLAEYVYTPWARALQHLGGAVEGRLSEVVNYGRSGGFPVSEDGREQVMRWSRVLDLEHEVENLRATLSEAQGRHANG